MGSILSWFSNLEIFVLNRRNDKYSIHSSEPNHPENLPPYQSTTSTNIGQNSQLLSTSNTTTFTNSIRCSNFYLACRNNDLNKVKQLLKTIQASEIDRLEPNGSTALHAACFHGHYEIVKLLLERGADRAIPNKYNCLPYDEAKNKEIKKLFFRVPSSNRLVSNTGAIEWNLIDDDALEKAMEEQKFIKTIYNDIDSQKMFERIEKNYIDQSLRHCDRIEDIRKFFQKATNEQDPLYIIKAYTAETDFYKVLNHEVACGATQCQSERRYIIALLSYHPKLQQLSYIGISYRIVEMIDDDLEKYQNKSLLMTKSFLSSSIDRKISEWFLSRQESTNKQKGQLQRLNVNGKQIKSWAMCIYHIKQTRTALYIENSSQYAMEGEILIMPYTVFKIKKFTKVEGLSELKGLLITEIELEEYV